MNSLSIPYHSPLTSAQLKDVGIPQGWHFGLADRTRFGELDILGHVNNTDYLRWLENFRIGYLRAYGISDYRGTPPRIVLKSIAVDFKKEMILHEDYIVTGRTAAFRSSSFRMEYAIWAPDLRATGEAVLVWLNQDGTKAALPDDVRQIFIDKDGATDER